MSSIFPRILVPYDGSKYSKRALTKAIEIAKKDESKIDIISVMSLDYIQPPGGLLGMVSPSSVNAIQKIKASVKKETENMLASQVSKCKIKGVKANYKVVTGNISEQILKYATQNKISLIVIGSQGLHGIKKLKVLGSTSRKISELASCPVMIVR